MVDISCPFSISTIRKLILCITNEEEKLSGVWAEKKEGRKSVGVDPRETLCRNHRWTGLKTSFLLASSRLKLVCYRYSKED